MEKTKKSDAGPVAVWPLLNAVTDKINSALSVKTAAFYLPVTVLNNGLKTGLSGFANRL